MALPVIGYRSILRNAGASISTVDGDASGFPVSNLHDYRSYTLWKSAVTTTGQFIDIDLGAGGESGADYVAVVNNTMANETNTLTVYADSFTPPTTSRASGQVDSTGVWYLGFTSPGALRYWRIGLTSLGGFNAAPSIGELFLGLKTELPHYMTANFEPFFDQVEVSGARSEGGHYLGATLRGHRHRGTISFGAAGSPRTNFTTALNAFIDDHAMLRRPFIFILDTGDTDFDAPRYVKATDDGEITRNAVAGSWANLDLSLDVEEAFMETAS